MVFAFSKTVSFYLLNKAVQFFQSVSQEFVYKISITFHAPIFSLRDIFCLMSFMYDTIFHHFFFLFSFFFFLFILFSFFSFLFFSFSFLSFSFLFFSFPFYSHLYPNRSPDPIYFNPYHYPYPALPIPPP